MEAFVAYARIAFQYEVWGWARTLTVWKCEILRANTFLINFYEIFITFTSTIYLCWIGWAKTFFIFKNQIRWTNTWLIDTHETFTARTAIAYLSTIIITTASVFFKNKLWLAHTNIFFQNKIIITSTYPLNISLICST